MLQRDWCFHLLIEFFTRDSNAGKFSGIGMGEKSIINSPVNFALKGYAQDDKCLGRSRRQCLGKPKRQVSRQAKTHPC